MPRTILIVDDLNTNRRILHGMLSKDYAILEAAGGSEALALLLANHASVSAVLLDISMPGMDGFEVLRRIRSNELLSSLPVIMITGSEDEETRVKSLALGANDFVMKPYSAEVIRHCLKNNIALHESVATVRDLQTDRLTGLWGREAFFQKAALAIEKEPAGHYLLGCVDIDNFKVINDQYGSEMGDRVLKSLADGLRASCDENGGICGRIYADCFVALFPRALAESAAIGPQALESRIFADTGLRPTLSVGRYLVADKRLSVSAMYDRAAIAKNSVKGLYDTHIAMYDEGMRRRIVYEQSIIGEMNGALAEKQFEVWFQPQYNHATDAMIGAEALVRWRHPQRGLIPPGDFIPVFEQNGFIYSLDKFVWEEVCRQLRKWLDAGRSPLPVSVNVSRYDVLRPDIVRVITGLVKQYRLPIELLRLEITESAFAESSQRIVDIVKELIDRGFTVEIDDFGSGYSSLNTLKDVPAQIIKLDMKFLASSSDSTRGGNIVESVVRMAKWLGMSVIAEGVETLAQANYLRSIGCHYMQGYLYARPMPAQRYEEYCGGSEKEERLLTLETVENLDNNRFWDPASMDTLIFNSYVGGACIYEYYHGSIELLRATEKYAQMVGSVGMTVEDALKLNWAEHLDAENSGRLVADLEESIRTKKEIIGEYVFLDLPGCPHETYLRSTMRVIASAGERYLVYCTNENITAQRQSEKREHTVTEQLQAIMRNIDAGVSAAVMEGDGFRQLFANDRYYEQLGYTKAQYEAQFSGAPNSILPKDQELVLRRCRAISATGKPDSFEFRIRRTDGAIRWLKSSVTIMNYPGESAPVQLAVTVDVTEQLAAQRRERNTAEQIQAMMRDMPGGFVRMHVGADGTIIPVYINDGFLKLVGMRRDAVIDLYKNDAMAGVHPDDVPIVREVVAKMLANGAAASSRYRLKADSGYIWLSVFGRVSTEVSGDTFLNIYYMDASEQVREEETQRALLDNLPGGAGIYAFSNGKMSLTYQNKSYWELVGLSDAAFPDPAPMSAVHPDDIPIIMQSLASAIERHQDVVCDIRLRHLTKGYLSVHLVGRIVQQETGGFLIYAIFTPNDQTSMSYQQTLPVVLSAIMGSTTDLAFAKDTGFRYLTASRAFANMVGKASVSDVVGKTDYDLFDAALADKFRGDDEALLKSGESIVDMIESIPSEDGSPRYSSTSKYLLRDGSGNTIGLYGVGRDITRSVVLDTQLRLVNDSVPGGLATYSFKDNAIRIVYCNDGFCKLFGGTREGYAQRGDFDPLDWIFKEDRAELFAQVVSLVRQNVPIDCLYRVHVVGGGFKWIHQRAAATERSGGTVLFNSILLDVTERQLINEQLRISEEENTLAARLGGNVICRFLIADRTLTLSPEVAAAYSLPETVSDVPYEPVRLGMVTPESADAYIGFFEAILHGSKAATATFQQKYFGKWRWMEAKSSTVFSDDGKPVKAVISFYDVTERLEKETIYKKWQQSLEDRPPESYTLYRCNLNHDANSATVEGDLIVFDFDSAGKDFNERAKAYIRQWVFPDDRDAYTAFMHSDTMLAAYYRGRRSDTLEYRELLAEGGFRWLRLTVDLVEYPNSTDVEAYLMYENIDETKRAELLTKELAETDPLTGILNRTAFTARVGQTLRLSRPETRNALLMLDVDNFKQVNDVFGHQTGDQTLIGLADALRAMLRRGDAVGRIGGDEFVLFLSDASDDVAIANKCMQICAIARKSFSLEVAISASIGVAVAPRDGMDFETLYGKADSALYHAKGSGKDSYAFYHDGMADEHLEPEPDSIDPVGTERTEKRRRMLIVDDNKLDHALLQNIFRDEFIIEKARDGNSALIRLRHYGSAISVVLLDLVMPGMDGFAVLQKIQSSAELRSIPVVIVSGDESRETCLCAIRAGATDYITKPVDAEILRIRVRSAVSRSENERLRAKNNLLEMQNEERIRYESALDSAGVTFIEYNWLTGDFSYYPSISKYLSGVYDGRTLWKILLSDLVADTQTVQDMQSLVHHIAEDRTLSSGNQTVRLKTPDQAFHSFRMHVRKLTNEYRLTNKLMISLIDLDYDVH